MDRADLEFYIPQILSIYLSAKTDEELQNQIERLILVACEMNLFFAHKVWFNLKASLINKEESRFIRKIF